MKLSGIFSRRNSESVQRGTQQVSQQVTQQALLQPPGGEGTKSPSIGVLEHESQQDQLSVKNLPDDLIEKIFDDVGLRHKVIGTSHLRLGGIALTALTEDDRRIINKQFIKVAANGHLNGLMYLHETFRLTAVDARADNNEAFRWAAENGHLEVLKWLCTTFGLTPEAAQSDILDQIQSEELSQNVLDYLNRIIQSSGSL